MSPSPVRARHRLGARRALLAGLALVIGGCGVVSRTAPPATPEDFPSLATTFRPLGISLTRVVSGDAGCEDPTLAPTAIGFDAAGLDQPSPVRIHLYIFRNRETFERRRADVPGCAASFVTDPATFEQIEQSPYVAAGQGPWAPGFEAALRTGLEQAAGTGG